MKKYLIVVLVSLFLFSCNSKHGNMIVKGKINNFQKGKVYLEKMQDTLLVKVDSVTLDGDNHFTLSDAIESPQVYYISISDSDKYLQFFGEKGTISVVSNLKTFGYNPLIKGSKNQELYEKYNVNNKKFNNLYLDLIKDKFDAQRDKDTLKLNTVLKKMKSVERRKYLYTINFAANHADFEVAPYLVLTEIPKANPKLLDTIEKAMTSKVKNSLYGKKFVSFLKKANK